MLYRGREESFEPASHQDGDETSERAADEHALGELSPCLSRLDYVLERHMDAGGPGLIDPEARRFDARDRQRAAWKALGLGLDDAARPELPVESSRLDVL
jgi:hypothetical protein